MTKQCFRVQREKCVCLTYGLPFGNKYIHLNQNGTFFTITVFCVPDVRNMLLEEQTEDLEWLIVPKVHMCWLLLDAISLPAGCPLQWSGNLLALRVRDGTYKRFGSVLHPCVAAWCAVHTQESLCLTWWRAEKGAISCQASQLGIAMAIRQIPCKSWSSPKDVSSFQALW